MSDTQKKAEVKAKKPRKWLKRAAWGCGGLAVLILAAVLILGFLIFGRLKASLPLLEGELVLAGLSHPVQVTRDHLGVPTLKGKTSLDLVRTLGFLHGQERFFQMDLSRRVAAGEVAELFGDDAVDSDREFRRGRLRSIAERVIARASEPDRARFQTYADGVNQGLKELGDLPPEYLLMNVEPAPWLAEDSVLVILAMFLNLSLGQAGYEAQVGLLYEALPEPLAAFLSPWGTPWDAALDGLPWEPLPLPGAEVFDLRTQPGNPGEQHGTFGQLSTAPPAPGSNAWAVAGSHTAHGGALLANDMHLGLRIPNTWYRAGFSRPRGDGSGEHRNLWGVTLPGTPGMVVGSNGDVAWGFTNGRFDLIDLIVVEPDPKNPNVYLSPKGPKPFQKYTEIIHAKGGAQYEQEILWTEWGPVYNRDHHGRNRFMSYSALKPGAVNLAIFDLEDAETAAQAMAIANRCGLPPNNFVVADRAGNIGWTIIGKLPKRKGFDGYIPGPWSDGSRSWDGWLAPDEYPRILNPPQGRVWSANNRPVGGQPLALLGNGGYLLGARAEQIRDRLMGLERATAADMLALQLDDRALFLEPWRDLLLSLLDDGALRDHPRRGECHRLLQESWTGRASVDSAAHFLVRAFRQQVAKDVFEPITAACKALDPDFNYLNGFQFEGPLWQLVEQRPTHLLSPQFETWEALFLAALDETLEQILNDGGVLAEKTWGSRNLVEIQHPFGFLPPLKWLNMPSVALPGDTEMPRFQTPSSGAAQRMVVSPGREEDGYFHMPGGQSGHPLSPFYSAGHQDWVQGNPTPFLPGPPKHQLNLIPTSY